MMQMKIAAEKSRLDIWLEEKNARMIEHFGVRQSFDARGRLRFERWLVNGRIIIVERYEDGGFEVFIPASESISIEATLRSLEAVTQ